MSIFGQNAILNQFSPKFVLKTVLDGQILIWDNELRAFVNVSAPTNFAGLIALQAQVTSLQATITTLNSRIVTLETLNHIT